jgi:hypothetical protein
MSPYFHLAFPVHDLQAARSFYVDVLGCREGRAAATWVDFDFHGHQISAHLRPRAPEPPYTNPVDNHNVPIPHFGLILSWDDWHTLAARLRERHTAFVIEPYIRFKGQVGEQATMFLLDPSGNALEFKSFQDETQVFAR